LLTSEKSLLPFKYEILEGSNFPKNYTDTYPPEKLTGIEDELNVLSKYCPYLVDPKIALEVSNPRKTLGVKVVRRYWLCRPQQAAQR